MATSDNLNVELKVRQTISESLCIDLEDVKPGSNLMRDLGAESIDFLDIVFRLEKDFDIKIPQREIERRARGGLTAEEFEIDGMLQEKGAARLREILPEIPASEIQAGMPLREIPAKFTVEVFINIVKRKLAGEMFPGDGDVSVETAKS
jgi:acyl carrier protein